MLRLTAGPRSPSHSRSIERHRRCALNRSHRSIKTPLALAYELAWGCAEKSASGRRAYVFLGALLKYSVHAIQVETGTRVKSRASKDNR